MKEPNSPYNQLKQGLLETEESLKEAKKVIELLMNKILWSGMVVEMELWDRAEKIKGERYD